MSDAEFLSTTRDSYDAIVDEYVEGVKSALDEAPLDRAMLGMFAELVRSTGTVSVADVGCGPGRVTVLLAEYGLDAFGVDLSPGMIGYARQAYPGLRFEVGSMLDLDLPDGGLGGLLAYFSIIHLPWKRRPEAFAEFHRVLVPGGYLMLVFQIGDEIRHRDEYEGKRIDLRFHRQRPAEVKRLLADAGFLVLVTVEQTPPTPGLPPLGMLVARKP
ncbi:methyltransferase domain-containing protein [Solwaraspora sp. WMMD406]|uniref:class I SAM-dependent methyltransferase n=1 Tax=Solwaraspora sp. WMMD406 TaxID=3016095 RepID=UPI0024179104|nr:class I SAM-dependent methyltransferase [Solwaraspora sp. WMMD406]MDG4763268.1 methyltransferase domain-containing protein [Solwaraspora sp. WMMD406]